MFLEVAARRNPQLVAAAVKLHQSGRLEPDTYVLDLDAILANAALIRAEADKYNISLYFMTKQFGRNPFVASHLMRLGYAGAVAVDFREADILAENGIPLGNVGHLVQIPTHQVEKMVAWRPEVMTVYSVAKAREIAGAARRQGVVQPLLLRVIDAKDTFYSGQFGGFSLSELPEQIKEIAGLSNISIKGVTSFPCLLFDYTTKDLAITNNMYTLLQAKQILKDMGIDAWMVNAPSATCCQAMTKLAAFGVTHGEPGHGILGTTPLHAVIDQPELPAVVYVSEVSHSLAGRSYCYGGGHYRRSGMRQALVGRRADGMRQVSVATPPPESIDYYLELEANGDVGDTAVFCFRTQIFVTRSKVAVVKGIQEGTPQVVGVFDSVGRIFRAVSRRRADNEPFHSRHS